MEWIMTSLRSFSQWQMSEEKNGVLGSTHALRLAASPTGLERRQHRRHDLEQQHVAVDRCADGTGNLRVEFGRLIDLSAGGVRVRTTDASVRPDQQIRVRLELPAFAGINPFIDTRGADPKPSREWVGWLAISRVHPLGGGQYEVAGRLVDMDEMDRGMLGLYLSTQPLAA
jgi:hypothetical protein